MRNLHAAKGQSLFELCAALMIGLPLLLACIDVAYIALGASINDSICRDATRAAASARPQKIEPSRHKVGPTQDAYLRAQAVVRTHNPSNLPIKVSEQVLVFELVRDLPPATMGGAVDGEVEVKTSVLIVPPFLLQAIVPSGIILSSTHSIPYTYSLRQLLKKSSVP